MLERLHQIPLLHDLKKNDLSNDFLKKTFHQYMLGMFEDKINLKYVFKRRAIAQAFLGIGFTPDWFLAACHLLNQQFIPLISKYFHKKPKDMLDVLLAYESLMNYQAKRKLSRGC